ncbi:MAG: hypothetical protein VX969_05135 [Verrucomicrobiota bacterium]|nr:hypothetical protein [Verrucomicrobiota bacterium]
MNDTEAGVKQGLDDFLGEGEAPAPIRVEQPIEKIAPAITLPDAPVVVDDPDPGIKEPLKSDPLEDAEAEKALSALEESSRSLQESYDELSRINNRKDQEIATLSTLNKKLIAEVNRLRGRGLDLSVPELSGDGSANLKLQGLRSEIKNLRGSLRVKSTEIEDLRMRNDSLEERISVLELNPSKKLTGSNPSSLTDLISGFDASKPAESTATKKPGLDEVLNKAPLLGTGCSLQFDAVVTALNGKNKEAFYTEFFVVNSDVETVLRKGGINLADFSGIDSYAELWARARKNSFLYPNVQKNVRSLLMKLVEDGQGQRIRTDINGAASLEGLPPGKFYVIGTASLGKVGVTWSVPVQLKTGANKLSLTLANAAWSL